MDPFVVAAYAISTLPFVRRAQRQLLGGGHRGSWNEALAFFFLVQALSHEPLQERLVANVPARRKSSQAPLRRCSLIRYEQITYANEVWRG